MCISVGMLNIQDSRMYAESTNSWGILKIEKSKCFCLPNSIWNRFGHHWPTKWFCVSIGVFVFNDKWLHIFSSRDPEKLYTHKAYTTSSGTGVQTI